ncbi:MAG: orotidine 5'-phosphate decarboxylase [Nitrososphaeraceae archaeon]|nr:orotidine 5'-phosphate decarboxylase [Nitrososphaeraceae archaeon]
MVKYPSYRAKIYDFAKNKKSPLILALDLDCINDILFQKSYDLISELGNYFCGIKINFHLLLSLSRKEILILNNFAKEKNISVIADIKLNDIGNTNIITINKLCHLGFDAVIVNPFIGISETKTLIEYAHTKDFGVLTLLYMSHPGAIEGYGLKIMNNLTSSNLKTYEKEIIPLYRILYNYGKSCNTDGFIIGGTKTEIIKEIFSLGSKIPIYSPGLITQGGNVASVINSGADYLIIGRYIINSSSPLKTTENLLKKIRQCKRCQY